MRRLTETENTTDMKLGLYFRQAWYNLGVNRVYSAVFIAGTALSLALVMAFLTVLSARVVNTVPETHRDRTMVISRIELRNETIMFGAAPNYRFARDFLKDMPEVECWSAVYTYYDTLWSAGRLSIRITIRSLLWKIRRMRSPTRTPGWWTGISRMVDRNFWKIFSLDFLYGRPISESGMDLNTPEAVVTESLARSLTGRTDAVGEKVYLDGYTLTVCGVVRDVPMSATLAFSEIWLPSTIGDKTLGSESNALAKYMNGNEIIVLLRDGKDIPAVRQACAGPRGTVQQYREIRI